MRLKSTLIQANKEVQSLLIPAFFRNAHEQNGNMIDSLRCLILWKIREKAKNKKKKLLVYYTDFNPSTLSESKERKKDETRENSNVRNQRKRRKCESFTDTEQTTYI